MLPRLDRNKIVQMYVEEKKSAKQIATELGCSFAGVRDNLCKAGVAMRGLGGSRTEKVAGFLPNKEFMQGAMAYFNQVASDAAKHYRVPYATWIDWLIKFELPRQRPGKVLIGRPSHRKIEIPIEEAVELSSSGVTYQELATKYGVSDGVIVRRMKEVGHKAPWRRTKDARFHTAQWHKRKVLQELNIMSCEICGENRSIDFCHIKPAADGGPITATNCLVLCPTHHRLFDSNELADIEFEKIINKVVLAAKTYGDCPIRHSKMRRLNVSQQQALPSRV